MLPVFFCYTLLMAKIIDFPRQHQPLMWRFASRRSRILQALKFLFKNLSAKNIQPHQMIVIYKLEDDEKNATYYLNMGFTPGDLVIAMHDVLEDAKKRPENWWEKGE